MLRPIRALDPPASGLDPLDRLAIGYLSVPLVVFLAGWFQWWVAVPLFGCLAYALRPAMRGVQGVPVTRLQLIVAIAAGSLWALLGGADHLVFANADWHVRDAVLHDLVVSAWPVGYESSDGTHSVLRAPVAFYLPAALAGKWLGLSAAHLVMGVWTATGAALFLLQVLSLLPSRTGVVLAATAVVIFFSGLDIVGSILNDGPEFRHDWNITRHLEWWAGKYQYSSMTTQLFWVPNHALGGWLAVGMLWRNPRNAAFDACLPLVVVALALWSPLTALGLVPFALLHAASKSLETRSWQLLHPKIWAPAAVIGSVVSAYLVMDPGGIPKGVAGGGRSGLALDLLQQAQFFLIEAGFLGAAILMIRPGAKVVLALAVLALLPLVSFGPANDLVMRASIPSLAVLAIAACLALETPALSLRQKRGKVALVALLLVGAVTPIEEIARSVLLPAWPINMQATLIGANCGHAVPHYIARIRTGLLARMMRPASRIPVRYEGAAACANPALELMWSWTFAKP